MFTDDLKSGARVVGVGIDIMRLGSIYPPYLKSGDPFLRATYSEREQAEAAKRRNSQIYYETRFCCKEAVFKTLGISGERVRFSEIEILIEESGRPVVNLTGALGKLAGEKGITEVLISLSYDGDIAQAVAIAQSII